MADLVRLWTTIPAGNTLTNRSIAAGTDFEVVMDVEAESGEFALGSNYTVGAVAINRTTGATAGPLPPLAASTPAYGVANPMSTGFWNPELDQFRWTVPAAFGAANDLIEILAFLTVGVGGTKEAHFTSTYILRA